MNTTKLVRFLTSIAALPMAFSACAATESPAPQTTAPVAVEAVEPAAPAAREAKPALWVLKDDDTTIYLFGTIHLLPKDVQWFNGPVKAAFASSEVLVLEMFEPPMGEMMKLMNKYGTATDGVNLSDRLDEPTRANYETAMKGIGLPVAVFETRQPWMVYLTIYGMQLVNSGWDINSGAEKILTDAANETGKPILELESADEQFAILSGFTMEEQTAMLSQVVNDPDGAARELNRLLDYWIAGDLDGLAAVMAETMGEAEAVETALLTKRNANWTVWLDAKMDEPGTYFVAVGAAHLAGDKSVQSMLAKEGHVAVRVPN